MHSREGETKKHISAHVSKLENVAGVTRLDSPAVISVKNINKWGTLHGQKKFYDNVTELAKSITDGQQTNIASKKDLIAFHSPKLQLKPE